MSNDVIDPTDFGGKFIAVKPSQVKGIHWAVGDAEYVVCQRRPGIPSRGETSKWYIMFKPAKEFAGFHQMFEVPLEIFQDSFKKSKK